MVGGCKVDEGVLYGTLEQRLHGGSKRGCLLLAISNNGKVYTFMLVAAEIIRSLIGALYWPASCTHLSVLIGP